MNKSQVAMADKRSRQRGFTLLASAACAVALFGMAGLAIDLGRMYITKNEAQSFADSASLYAAMQLDGSPLALANADAAVAANTNKWNFNTSAFAGTVTEYSADGSTGWATSATAIAANMRYARVSATVDNVALFFLPATGTGTTATVKVSAVAGQQLAGGASPIKNGLFPYSPVSHVMGSTASAVYNNTTLPFGDPTHNFGFTPGQQYDLKWPMHPDKSTPCAGDDDPLWINRVKDAGSSPGEIELQSASALASVVDGLSNVNIQLDASVNPTNGDKNSIVKAFNTRAGQDGDQTSLTYADYIANPYHNGRRLITVVVNSGWDDYTGNPIPGQHVAVGYAQFLLLPGGTYKQSGGGNNPWCGIYVGNNPDLGGTDTGGGSSGGQGVGFIRLTQ